MEVLADYLTAEQRQEINDEYNNKDNIATVADTGIKSKDYVGGTPAVF